VEVLASVRWAHAGRALPVYLRSDHLQQGLQPGAVEALGRALEGLRSQRVWLAQGRRLERRPFTLPLNLHTLDARSQGLLQETRGRCQELFEQAESQGGLCLEHVDTSLSVPWFERVRPDILIGRTARLRGLFSNLSEKVEARPRLLIAVDAEPHEAWQRLPPGVSLLSLREDVSRPEILGRFLEVLLSDSSLSDAFFETGVKDVAQARLVTDPKGNHSLRMSSALAGVLDDALSRAAESPTSSPASRIPARPARRPGTSRGGSLAGGAATPPPARGLQNILSEAPYFAGHESLSEAARHRVELEAVPPASGQDAEDASPEPLLTPEPEETLAGEDALPTAPQPLPRQERRVDLRLERLEDSPLLAGGLPAVEFQWVGPRVALRQSGRYRLRVQIGLPLPGSIMVGVPPPIDPLLPPPKDAQGHELEVVVYPLDFTLEGASQQKLLLPLTGASAALHFALKAPSTLGAARLRVGVYLRNHLLQSFLVSATVEVEEREVPGPSAALSAGLELARSASFQNLNALTPRALCIGVNEDPSGGTHTFMVKGTDAATFRLTEAFLSTQVAEFRRILAWAALDEAGGPRFPSRPLPGQPPSPAFHEVVRQLADWGGQVHHALFERASPKMQEALRAVANGADGILQIVRHDTNFVFPWAAVYDFRRPEAIEGAPPPRVCTGFSQTSEGAITPCGHRRQDAVYCARGFWGLRHRVEQVLSPYAEDAVQEISHSDEHPRIELAVGTEDHHTRKLQQTLRERFGPSLREVTGTDALLDLLWNPRTRPSQLIVMGHLETRPIAGEPQGPRLVLPSRERWLRAAAVADRTIDDRGWDQPRPLVFLMACSAAATQLSTPNDLLLALARAGAAAVIGTECIIFSGMASRFADEVTDALWRHRPLADAVNDFRANLLREGNPLAFAFTVYGDAELTLKGVA